MVLNKALKVFAPISAVVLSYLGNPGEPVPLQRGMSTCNRFNVLQVTDCIAKINGHTTHTKDVI